MMVLPVYIQFCTHQFTPSLAGDEDQCNNINNEVVIIKQTRHCGSVYLGEQLSLSMNQ